LTLPDASLARLRRHAVWAAGIFALGGLFWGPKFFLGAVGGAVFALANFEALSWMVSKLTGTKPQTTSWLGVVGVLFRYILLSIALFVIIGVWHANVVAVALGFSAPVAAVFVECGLYAYQELRAEREPRQ
jgi:hypothetical protein